MYWHLFACYFKSLTGWDIACAYTNVLLPSRFTRHSLCKQQCNSGAYVQQKSSSQEYYVPEYCVQTFLFFIIHHQQIENVNLKFSGRFSHQTRASILGEKLNRRSTTNSPLKTTSSRLNCDFFYFTSSHTTITKTIT